MNDSTKIAMGPIMNVILAMMLLAICVLMGHKVTSGRGWDKKSGEGSSRGGGSTQKQKRGKTVGKNL